MARTPHGNESLQSEAAPRRHRRWRLGWLLVAALLAIFAPGQPAQAVPPTSPTTAPASNGALGDRIVQIAMSQVGNADNPVSHSFAGLNCNPYTSMVGGFSANSNGCGSDSTFNVRNSDENWCADFVKWVWQQAGITENMNTINAAASSVYAWALQDGQNPQPNTGTPAVGDAIVFFPPGTISATGAANHVGIVSAVHDDGTIDMVNGDFLATANVHVEHDTNLTLSTFENNTWNQGEQYLIVHPPSGLQHPDPSATLTGPSTVVAGTEAAFAEPASEPDGTVSGYYWTFGDGRATNNTGESLTHVFATPGTYTITATATSNFGTITTLHKNVTVLAASGSVAAVPSTQTWYTSYPVSYYRFVRSSTGLAVDHWDSESWLQVATAGTPSATGSIASLAYPDATADSATTPHAFYRAADGSLAETSFNGSAWVSADLPGTPAVGADIVAAVTASGPAVFFVDAHGRLNETTQQSDAWTTRVLSGPTLRPAPVALAQTTSGPKVFAVTRSGKLTVTSQAGHALLPTKVSRDATLAAVTMPSGAASVIVNGAKGRGSGFVQLTERSRGAWVTTQLPGRPAAGAAVSAANYLEPAAVTEALGVFPNPPGSLTPVTPRHQLGTAVAYVTGAHKTAVSYTDGGRWQTTTLPGTARAVTGLSALPVAHQPLQVYLDTASGPAMATTGDTAPATGPWTVQSMPAAPATFADRVLLYAAGSSDLPAADAAAAAAGLPESQVTTSYETAWAATLSGDHLVIAVGQAAVNALEFNTCGFANPSAVDPGSTPFDYVTATRTTLPGADLFMNGAASTASQGQERATDLAYFAVHGSLPSGETAVPAPALAARTCLGSAS